VSLKFIRLDVLESFVIFLYNLILEIIEMCLILNLILSLILILNLSLTLTLSLNNYL